MPKVLTLEDGSIEIEPSQTRVANVHKTATAFSIQSFQHPDVGSQVEINRKVYEVEAGPDPGRIVLKLVRVVP